MNDREFVRELNRVQGAEFEREAARRSDWLFISQATESLSLEFLGESAAAIVAANPQTKGAVMAMRAQVEALATDVSRAAFAPGSFDGWLAPAMQLPQGRGRK